MAKRMTRKQIEAWRKKNQLRAVSGDYCKKYGYDASPHFNPRYQLERCYERVKKNQGHSCPLWQRSVVRLYNAVFTAHKSTIQIDLMANIRYFKEYGKLPDNTDMEKVKGKGMYGRRHGA